MVPKLGKKEGAKKSSKDEFGETNIKKMKKIVLKLKGFLGFLTCKGIKEALIKQKKFSFILKLRTRYIAIYVTNKRIEIFDPSGFTCSRQPCELINFIKAQSINRKLVVNIRSFNANESLRHSLLFLLLHKNLTSYDQTVNHLINYQNKMLIK